MQRVEYAFYRAHYGGEDAKLTATEFDRYSRRSLAFLKRVTFGRIEDCQDTEIFLYAVCEIAERMKQLEERYGIANESNDGYSVSYRFAGDEGKNEEEQYMNIAKAWLPVELFYRGI